MGSGIWFESSDSRVVCESRYEAGVVLSPRGCFSAAVNTCSGSRVPVRTLLRAAAQILPAYCHVIGTQTAVMADYAKVSIMESGPSGAGWLGAQRAVRRRRLPPPGRHNFCDCREWSLYSRRRNDRYRGRLPLEPGGHDDLQRRPESPTARFGAPRLWKPHLGVLPRGPALRAPLRSRLSIIGTFA
jgi:hypothetical protein